MSNAEATGAAVLHAVPSGTDLRNPIRTADDLAAAFLAAYKPATREAYARDLRAWGAFLTELGVPALSARRVHVDAWARATEAGGVAPATLARRLSALAGFYAYALDEGLIDRSPVVRVRRPKVSQESTRLGVDRDGLRRLLAAAEAVGPRDRALITLLALNGLRVSEALALDVPDLGVERGHRTVSLVRKGGKRQRVAVAARTAEALDLLVGDRADGPLFTTRSGRRVDRHAAAKTVARLGRAAGLSQTVTPHQLRHGFVTAALDAGVTLRDVQDAAGHADPRTTRRYDRSRHSLDRAATYSVATYLS